MPYKNQFIKVKKYFGLVAKSHTQLKLKVTTRAIGTPFSDQLSAEECWDAHAEGKGAENVAVRHSFRVLWNKKPESYKQMEENTAAIQKKEFSEWIEWAELAVKEIRLAKMRKNRGGQELARKAVSGLLAPLKAEPTLSNKRSPSPTGSGGQSKKPAQMVGKQLAKKAQEAVQRQASDVAVADLVELQQLKD